MTLHQPDDTVAPSAETDEVAGYVRPFQDKGKTASMPPHARDGTIWHATTRVGSSGCIVNGGVPRLAGTWRSRHISSLCPRSHAVDLEGDEPRLFPATIPARTVEGVTRSSRERCCRASRTTSTVHAAHQRPPADREGPVRRIEMSRSGTDLADIRTRGARRHSRLSDGHLQRAREITKIERRPWLLNVRISAFEPREPGRHDRCTEVASVVTEIRR